jgi:hypothetical protein
MLRGKLIASTGAAVSILAVCPIEAAPRIQHWTSGLTLRHDLVPVAILLFQLDCRGERSMASNGAWHVALPHISQTARAPSWTKAIAKIHSVHSVD